MDKEDIRGFKIFVLSLLVGGVFAIAGIGAVIPFIKLLVTPDKVESFILFKGIPYHEIVIVLTIAMIVAFAAKNFASFILQKINSKYLFGIVKKIQCKLFEGYMKYPYSYHLSRNTPDLIKYINNETNILSSFIVSPVGVILTEAVSSLFVLLLLVFLNPVFSTIVISCLLLGILIFLKSIKKRSSYHANVRTEAWSSMTSFVLSGLSGVKEAKLYGRENVFINGFYVHADKLRQANVFVNIYQQAPKMLIEFIGLMVVMSVLCVFILSGDNTSNILVLLGVFGIAAGQLLPSLNRITQGIVSVKYGMPALKLIYSELQQIREATPCAKNKSNDVERMQFSTSLAIKNLSYHYENGPCALNNISLSIKKGSRVAFVGPSGAGKSTLVDVIMGLFIPTNGSINVDGIDISSDEKVISYQKNFAYVPQSINLFNVPIKYNVAFGVVDENHIDEDRLWYALRVAQLDVFVRQLPDKENTIIGEHGVRMSGGQRQRLGIARAIYQNREVLVLDEATSALDNQTEQLITNIVASLDNITIITIAHRYSTIKNYDVIFFMENGEVISSGSYDFLLARCPKFRKMAEMGGISRNI